MADSTTDPVIREAVKKRVLAQADDAIAKLKRITADDTTTHEKEN